MAMTSPALKPKALAGAYRKVPGSSRDAEALEACDEGLAAPEAKDKEAAAVLRAVLATMLYVVAGPGVIFLNKHIMVEVGFPYGGCLSLLGVGTSTCVSALALIAGWAPAEQLGTVTPAFFATRVAPIGVALAGTLTFGNAAYLYNSVAFVQILKAFAPVVLLSLLFLLRLERPRLLLCTSIFIIVVGTAVAVEGEVHSSERGIVIMLTSELFEAVKLVMMQVLLVDRKFGAVEGLALMGPAAVVALAVAAYATEDVADAARKVSAHPVLFAAASFGGLLVNLSTNVMLANTSALTLRVTSLVRNISVVFASTLVVRDSIVTPEEYFGFALSIVGVVLYQHAKRFPKATLASTARDAVGACATSLPNRPEPPPCCIQDSAARAAGCCL